MTIFLPENEEIYQKYNIIKNFCNEFDNLWIKSSDDNDSVNYDDLDEHFKVKIKFKISELVNK